MPWYIGLPVMVVWLATVLGIYMVIALLYLIWLIGHSIGQLVNSRDLVTQPTALGTALQGQLRRAATAGPTLGASIWTRGETPVATDFCRDCGHTYHPHYGYVGHDLVGCRQCEAERPIVTRCKGWAALS
jgi:hypothetical protein